MSHPSKLLRFALCVALISVLTIAVEASEQAPTSVQGKDLLFKDLLDEKTTVGEDKALELDPLSKQSKHLSTNYERTKRSENLSSKVLEQLRQIAPIKPKKFEGVEEKSGQTLLSSSLESKADASAIVSGDDDKFSEEVSPQKAFLLQPVDLQAAEQQSKNNKQMYLDRMGRLLLEDGTDTEQRLHCYLAPKSAASSAARQLNLLGKKPSSSPFKLLGNLRNALAESMNSFENDINQRLGLSIPTKLIELKAPPKTMNDTEQEDKSDESDKSDKQSDVDKKIKALQRKVNQLSARQSSVNDAITMIMPILIAPIILVQSALSGDLESGIEKVMSSFRQVFPTASMIFGIGR